MEIHRLRMGSRPNKLIMKVIKLQFGTNGRTGRIVLLNILLFFTGHLYATGYGYSLGDDAHCAVWWTEGACKVMRGDPAPGGKVIPVRINAAKNEFESFQIILTPHKEIRNFFISAGLLKNESGDILPASSVVIRKVAYVHVIRPTDDYGKAGWYPDPLPCLEGSVNLDAGKNHPFWLTIHVPASAKSGKYSGTLKLSADGWTREIPVSVRVWNFTLPEKPSIRSSFGINTTTIRQYHNLRTEDELKEVTGKYYRMMSEYKIAPTDPFRLYPMKVTVKGLHWSGGIFSTDTVCSGKKALKVTDNDPESDTEASTTELMGIDPEKNYTLTWYARTLKPGQQYCVLVRCYDESKNPILFENRMDAFKGHQNWKTDTLRLRPFRKEIRYVTVHLFPALRERSGRSTGTAWFDDVRLTADGNGTNLIPQGDFEVNPEDLTVSVDFTEFDKAGEKYLDELGFNAYNLPLEGLPSGNFYSRQRGVFHGFAQGTPEYDRMMNKYLGIVQDHLKARGWLGKEYVYWFDEPNPENYSFVREGMEIIHRGAPGITRFITEHRPGPDIMDVTEISCTVIGKLNRETIKDLTAKGREFWSYVCCCPKAPYLSLFIDHDAVNMRMWLWLSYLYQLKGILVWSANYWNSATASPEGYLQNPWEDPMSYTVGYGLPWGKQAGWGNGDGRFFYPPNRHPNDHAKKYMEGPVPSIRLENLRDGIEDYEYLLLLKKVAENGGSKNKKLKNEALKLLNLPPELVSGPKDYNKNPQDLIHYRNRIGEILNTLTK